MVACLKWRPFCLPLLFSIFFNFVNFASSIVIISTSSFDGDIVGEILGAYIPTILGYNGGPIPYIGGIQLGYPTIQGNFPQGIRKLGGVTFCGFVLGLGYFMGSSKIDGPIVPLSFFFLTLRWFISMSSLKSLFWCMCGGNPLNHPKTKGGNDTLLLIALCHYTI